MTIFNTAQRNHTLLVANILLGDAIRYLNNDDVDAADKEVVYINVIRLFEVFKYNTFDRHNEQEQLLHRILHTQHFEHFPTLERDDVAEYISHVLNDDLKNNIMGYGDKIIVTMFLEAVVNDIRHF